MRILAVTNMYPMPGFPNAGIFVEQQIRSLREIGLTVDVILVNRLERGMSAYIGLARQVCATVRTFRPDLIHSMYGGVMAEQVTKSVNDRPTLVTFHGSDLLGENLSGSVRKILACYGVRCSRRAARRASGIVTVSRVLLDALAQDVDRAKVRVIPCGIDLQRFKPLDKDICRARLAWDPGRFHVLFQASSNPVKRPGLARAAVERLSHFGIRAEIHYLRGVANSQVPVWLNASDVVLLTSLHEGSPTIIKEALACNLPVVSVNVGDVAERIQDVAGCYIALPELHDIATKLSWVHRGPRQVSGRVKMEALSLERIAHRLKENYEEVVASFGKGEGRLRIRPHMSSHYRFFARRERSL
jgi:teichuronic acid biosynthesis glycosyltransferase TuaC